MGRAARRRRVDGLDGPDGLDGAEGPRPDPEHVVAPRPREPEPEAPSPRRRNGSGVGVSRPVGLRTPADLETGRSRREARRRAEDHVDPDRPRSTGRAVTRTAEPIEVGRGTAHPGARRGDTDGETRPVRVSRRERRNGGRDGDSGVDGVGEPRGLGGLRPPATGRASVSGRSAASAVVPRPSTGVSRLGPRQGGGGDRPLAGEPEFVQRLNPFELPDPRGYSHTTVARGQMVFLAGQTGVDYDGRIVDGGIVKQFDRAVQNLLIALAAAGGGPEHLTSLTVQVTDLDEYKANSRPIGHVWRSRLGGGFPALSLTEVRRFWDPEAVVQIDGHAVVP